jgi:hypothetical protein
LFRRIELGVGVREIAEFERREIAGRTGSEVMRRIAAPMIWGMITAPILSMLVLPAAYLLIHRRELRRRLSRKSN